MQLVLGIFGLIACAPLAWSFQKVDGLKIQCNLTEVKLSCPSDTIPLVTGALITKRSRSDRCSIIDIERCGDFRALTTVFNKVCDTTRSESNCSIDLKSLNESLNNSLNSEERNCRSTLKQSFFIQVSYICREPSEKIAVMCFNLSIEMDENPVKILSPFFGKHSGFPTGEECSMVVSSVYDVVIDVKLINIKSKNCSGYVLIGDERVCGEDETVVGKQITLKPSSSIEFETMLDSQKWFSTLNGFELDAKSSKDAHNPQSPIPALFVVVVVMGLCTHVVCGTVIWGCGRPKRWQKHINKGSLPVQTVEDLVRLSHYEQGRTLTCSTVVVEPSNLTASFTGSFMDTGELSWTSTSDNQANGYDDYNSCNSHESSPRNTIDKIQTLSSFNNDEGHGPAEFSESGPSYEENMAYSNVQNVSLPLQQTTPPPNGDDGYDDYEFVPGLQ